MDGRDDGVEYEIRELYYNTCRVTIGIRKDRTTRRYFCRKCRRYHEWMRVPIKNEEYFHSLKDCVRNLEGKNDVG